MAGQGRQHAPDRAPAGGCDAVARQPGREFAGFSLKAAGGSSTRAMRATHASTTPPGAEWRAGPLRAPPPEQTTLYRLVQQHAATFIAETKAATGIDLPQFVKDEFDAFLGCGILAHGLLRLRCGDRGHDQLVAFSCRRRAFARRAVRGAWRRRRRTWWTTSSLMCRCGSGCCHCPSRCDCCWPRRLTWPTTTANPKRPACSGRFRPQPALIATPSVLGPDRRC